MAISTQGILNLETHHRTRFEDANAAAESKLAAKKAELKAVQDNVRAAKFLTTALALGVAQAIL